MKDLTIPAAVLGLALCAGSVLAGSVLADDGPPELDVEKTCRNSASANVSISDNASVDGCLRSERAARDDIKKRWNEFTPAAKSQCSKQAVAGGFPSYVETVTCLELATGAMPTQSAGDPGAGKDTSRPAATSGEKDSPLTAEPSPKQRTNPIDVLERKP